jgi:proteasome lid subunit RPN8/RPN11
MFYVNIVNEALRKIVSYTQSSDEKIGLLIGVMAEDGLWVTDVISGYGPAHSTSTVLLPQALARVADDIIKGRIEGTIIGWYHSHIGHGIFLSNVDIDTQLKLQQLSPYVIALVIDPTINQFGVFMYDPRLGLVQLPSTQIRIV